jgi:predicted RND superfamily exporter protein
MWSNLARFIIKFRLPLMLVLAAITAFMAYQIPKLTLSYDYVAAVPPSDSSMQYYEDFRQQFGEDANLLVVGVQDSALYEVETFRRFAYLSNAIKELRGVKYVLSLPELQQLKKNPEAQRFEVAPVFPEIPSDQATLDSLLRVANDLQFYSQQLINPNNGATFLLVAIEKKTLNSDKREQLVPDIQMLGKQFSEVTGVELHYAGIPFVRTVMNEQVRAELQLFLILSVVVTALILLLFFRSWDAVVFPLLIIAIVVVWSMGTLVLLGYEITLLSGLLPPIIVVIGIPNSVYLLNKYHQEYKRYRDKHQALRAVVEKMGTATLITNVTTAIGFLVLLFTNVPMLEEFGLVAGINILATFVVSIILIPSVFSYLPAPGDRQLRHLRLRGVDWVLTRLDLLVHRHRYRVLMGAGVVTLLFLAGFLRLESISYLVDDVPDDSQLKQDLAFFEDNFAGIMPLEVVVDTHKKRSATRLATLQKVEELEQFLEQQPAISQPVSAVGLVKSARQAFYGGNPDFYALPTRRDQGFIARYLKNSGMNDSGATDGETASGNSPARLLRSFADSTGQQLRVSLKVADVGSDEIQNLIDNIIEPKAEEIFGDSDTEVTVTGTSLLFAKSNAFLIRNLLTSLFIAFCLIAAIMAMLFGSVRMILISLIPNLIPLIVTAGIMGLVGIPLKPSTAIIFSIVFGISVDDSIHFLAKYRQEMKHNRFFVPLAISKSLRETGTSMVYTSVILFFGFIIFAGSGFGGTQNLGILTSLTLLVAMLTNLTVLPALLMIFDDGKKMAARQQQAGTAVVPPLIEHYDEFYQEDEDEEIDVDKLELPDREREEA